MLSLRLILAARLRSAACGCCLIAMFGLPSVAAAQALYKSILPDGRVVYGDKPAPGAAKVIEKRPDPSTAGLGGTSPREAQLLEEFRNARISESQGPTRRERGEGAGGREGAARSGSGTRSRQRLASRRAPWHRPSRERGWNGYGNRNRYGNRYGNRNRYGNGNRYGYGYGHRNGHGP